MLWQKALRGLTLRPRLLAACLRVLLQGTMNFMTEVDYGADTLCIVLRTTQIACDSVPATEQHIQPTGDYVEYEDINIQLRYAPRVHLSTQMSWRVRAKPERTDLWS